MQSPFTGYSTDNNQNEDLSSTIHMLPVFYFFFSIDSSKARKKIEYYLSNMQTINFALDRTHFQCPGWVVPFDLREGVHFFNLFVFAFFTIWGYKLYKRFCLCDCPSIFSLGGSFYCACEILIANPIEGVRNLVILLLVKLICNWQQPRLVFIKYDAHATYLLYFHFFSRSTVQRCS